MKNSATVSRVKVSADGHGVLSHAGIGIVREVADLTGLSEQVTAVLADTYRGQWSHAPGAVFADLVAAVADGADCVDYAAQATRSRSEVFGPAASTTTMWRLIDERIDAEHLPAIRTAHAQARASAWAAGAAPTTEWLHIDVDATITIDHSDGKENAAATWKRTFGMHPLMAYLDRPDIASGEALAALLRPGNAGSNTTADHITVLHQGLQSLPQDYRPTPGAVGGQKILVRSDSAGATHGFAAPCRDAGVEFSFGFAVDHRVRDAVEHLNAIAGWMPAIDSDGENREGAWIGEATDLILPRFLAGRGQAAAAQRTPPILVPSSISPIPTDTGSPRSSPTPADRWYPVGWPDCSCGTANMRGSKTGSAKPKPPAYETCPATNSRQTPPGSKSSLQPPTWSPGPNSSGSPTTRTWPAAKSKPSATGSCT